MTCAAIAWTLEGGGIPINAGCWRHPGTRSARPFTLVQSRTEAGCPVAPLRSRVWQRHGQLRLYISGDGLDVGWCDPRTGRFEFHQPTLEPEFWQAVHAGYDQLLRDGRLREAVIHRPVPPRMTARPLAELVAPADPPGAAPELEPSPPAAVPNRPGAARAPGAALVPDEHWVVRDPRWDDLASNSHPRCLLRLLRQDRPASRRARM
jgi:hypothetical protein